MHMRIEKLYRAQRLFMGAVQEQHEMHASCKRRVASVRKELRACVWEA